MSWNTSGYIFESQVIGAYELGKLDQDLLQVLAEPFAQTDIDYGDLHEVSSDGKTIYEIVVEIISDTLVRPKGKRKNNQQWDDYTYDVYEKFKQIAGDNFGWNVY